MGYPPALPQQRLPMSQSRLFLLLLVFGLSACQAALNGPPPRETRAPWPQGSGPNGNWSASGVEPPAEFSVRRGINVRWSTPLPETGQGGIALADRVGFVTTMEPWSEDLELDAEEAERFKHATEGRRVVGKHIDAHCFDRETGAVLWTRRLEGSVPSIYSYPFSDATSTSPVTDGEHVWFTNAGGRVVCFDLQGTLVWEREFVPTFEGPFNKQFEPFLVHDQVDGDRVPVLIHMEPFVVESAEGDLTAWNFLVGLHGLTGAELWRSEDALTHYNAPTLLDSSTLLHARGGPHAVPERPVGMSATAIRGPQAGQALWRYEDPRGNHEASLQNAVASDEYVLWILKKDRNALVLLDRNSAQEVREISLSEGVRWHEYDQEQQQYVTHEDHQLEKGVFPARYSLVAQGKHAFFQCYATAWGKPNLDPPYSFARVDLEEGTVEYLEVPTGFAPDSDAHAWRTPQAALALNSRGVEVTGDDRSHWDGWDWVFNGTPTWINDRLYFTLASGLVYVFDTDTAQFDASAFEGLADLGPAGQTWSANSLSYADGQIYHRTAAELLCFEVR